MIPDDSDAVSFSDSPLPPPFPSTREPWHDTLFHFPAQVLLKFDCPCILPVYVKKERANVVLLVLREQGDPDDFVFRLGVENIRQPLHLAPQFQPIPLNRIYI